jgi:hypothetical protein
MATAQKRMAPPRQGSGIGSRLWLLAALALALGVLVYGVTRQSTPSAFDRPEAQIPNKLRSPWGGVNPF